MTHRPSRRENPENHHRADVHGAPGFHMREHRTSHAIAPVRLTWRIPAGFVRQPMNFSATVHPRVVDQRRCGKPTIDPSRCGFTVDDITLKSPVHLAKCLGTAQY